MEGYTTAKAAANTIGIEYCTLLSRIRKGKIKAKKFGWAIMVPDEEVKRVKQEERAQ